MSGPKAVTIKSDTNAPGSESKNNDLTIFPSGAARVSGDVRLVGASAGDGAIQDGADSGIRATVKDYANAKPLTVALVNASGDVYNAGGGGGGDVVVTSMPPVVVGGATAPIGVSGDVSVKIADATTPSQKAIVYSSGAVRLSGDVVAVRSGIFGTAAVLASGDGDTTVVAAVAGRRIYLYAEKIIASRGCHVKWKDGSSLELEGAMAVAPSGGFVSDVAPPAYLLATTAGNPLVLNVSLGGLVGGRVSYWTAS